MTSNTAKIILGIDPGTVVMGYGIIEVQGSKTKLIAAGVLQLSKVDDATLKLKKIFDRVSSLIVEYCPDELAIEAPFYGKNVQSMLKLGRAQGVAIAAALYKEIPVQEYSPRKIKQAVTGKGSASKEQVAAMLKQTIGFDVTPKFLDATDALAVAVCHSLQKSLSSENKKNYTGWKAFLVNNPEKLKKS
ncbi:MAG: crossover junction endodeoxyribonuclease RuvC [Bacteroidetes bacterium]|nr:crossover junction endodeoxyribonuclease RuvC [Bacteroidota bacterium]